VKVHSDQLQHVWNGCLSCPRQDLPCNGSRIEGSHKGWNSLQRAYASGIVMFTALGHDFVLHCNIRVASAGCVREATPFVKSLFGSHHVWLASYTAELWNLIVEKQPSGMHLKPLPTLPEVKSGETFGVVDSEHASTYEGWIKVKHEDEDENLDLSQINEDIINNIIEDFGIDPSLYLQANMSVRATLKDGQVSDSASEVVIVAQEQRGSVEK